MHVGFATGKLQMTSIKDAPLPWTMVQNSWQYTTIYDATGEVICRLDLEDWGVNEENQYDLEQRQEMVAQLILHAVNHSGGLDGLPADVSAATERNDG
jgi:hypothetical protein